jgi:adenylate kinase family enzyme/inosine/xanthosine triphosphate pyrophosphatase family protein
MIEIVFFTSSRIKLEHAKYLCRGYDIQIAGFREKTFRANYIEPRIYDRDELIESSYQDALERWKKAIPGGENRFFFIEDTSVVIDALSTVREIPGLDVKYWMQDINFESLDAQLKAAGNNRKATVRSDLILHVPPAMRSEVDGKEYLWFTSTSSGNVVKRESQFDTNPMYPWLDNQTFNKWFVPDGCAFPVSRLPISEANKFDFRAGAFEGMLSFLEKYRKVLRRTAPSVQASFDFGSPLFVICGPSCAGKTTLAEHLAKQYGYYHIEASDFMYLSYYQRHGVGSKRNVGDFAQQALLEKPEIVAEQIVENLQQGEDWPAIVTGFRSPKEVDWFSRNYSGKYSIEVVYVIADFDVRYSRSVARMRDGEADTRNEFVKRDEQQAAMGLAELEKRFVSNRIVNNDSLDDFYRYFEDDFIKRKPQRKIDGSSVASKKITKLEDLILKALAIKWESRDYFTTTEISHLINLFVEGKPKNKNNISRYFNQTFYPYYEVKLVEGKKKYRLSNTGYGKYRALNFGAHNQAPPTESN